MRSRIWETPRFFFGRSPASSAEAACFACLRSLNCPNSSAKSSFLGFAFFSAFFLPVFFCLTAFVSFTGASSASSCSPTTLRFFRYTKKLMTKEVRLSPFMPMMANRAAGSTVRQAMMIFVVSVTGRWNTGRPMSSETASASAAFLSLMVPPNTVPVSMKFGGMMYMSFSSCRMDIL